MVSPAAGLLVAFALLSPVPVFAAADPFAGNIRVIESDSPFNHATIARAEQKREAMAVQGDAVFRGDTVRTYEGVKVQIELSDGSHIFLAPNSTVELKTYFVNQASGKRNQTLRALKGTVRFLISKIFKNRVSGAQASWRDSNVTLTSPTAIAGIKGSDGTVSIEPDGDEWAVTEGIFSLKSSDPSARGEVLLTANQVSRVQRGAPGPGVPAALTQQRKEQLMRHTTPARVLRQFSRGPGQGPKKIMKKGDLGIARDLAAGVPLKDIIKDAIRDGASIEMVIAEAIAGGVDPGILVYTAIAEGYPAQAVIKAAVTAGAPLNAVVGAALGAGADNSIVYAGAADAGAPPSDVAETIAGAAPLSPPVYGDTAPDDSPPVYTPPPTVEVGGGAGAESSTQPSSPYTP
jgi:hypothetical protein